MRNPDKEKADDAAATEESESSEFEDEDGDEDELAEEENTG